MYCRPRPWAGTQAHNHRRRLLLQQLAAAAVSSDFAPWLLFDTGSEPPEIDVNSQFDHMFGIHLHQQPA